MLLRLTSEARSVLVPLMFAMVIWSMKSNTVFQCKRVDNASTINHFQAPVQHLRLFHVKTAVSSIWLPSETKHKKHTPEKSMHECCARYTHTHTHSIQMVPVWIYAKKRAIKFQGVNLLINSCDIIHMWMDEDIDTPTVKMIQTVYVL